jgi:hypothetical protein
VFAVGEWNNIEVRKDGSKTVKSLKVCRIGKIAVSFPALSFEGKGKIRHARKRVRKRYGRERGVGRYVEFGTGRR